MITAQEVSGLNPDEVTYLTNKFGNELLTEKISDSCQTFFSSCQIGLVAPAKMSEFHKYKSAKLVKGTDKGKPYFYVEFYAFDALTGKLRRKRLTSINAVEDLKQREAVGYELVKQVNDLLVKGFHFNDVKLEKYTFLDDRTTKTNFYTTEQGLKYAYEIKCNELSKRSVGNYKHAMNYFLIYSDLYSLRHQNIKLISKQDIYGFLDFLRITKELKGQTINAIINQVRSLFNVLVEREILDTNHFKIIKKQKETSSTKNIAYSTQQIELLKKRLAKDEPLLWFFCQFIFYSFARPNEIRQIKYKDIDLENRYIFINSTISKTKRERYIYINDSFFKVLKQELHKEYNPNHLVFNINKSAPLKPIGTNTLMSKYRVILDELGFDKDYTLYSWKHTGNVLSYKKGIDIHTLMRQNGHTSIETTINYLKSLGLRMDNDLYSKFNEVSI